MYQKHMEIWDWMISLPFHSTLHAVCLSQLRSEILGSQGFFKKTTSFIFSFMIRKQSTIKWIKFILYTLIEYWKWACSSKEQQEVRIAGGQCIRRKKKENKNLMRLNNVRPLKQKKDLYSILCMIGHLWVVESKWKMIWFLS